jgi:hypothetical protein
VVGPALLFLGIQEMPMARSFCAASDLQSHDGVWASLKNGEPEKENGEPIIATAVEIAAHYAHIYSNEN